MIQQILPANRNDMVAMAAELSFGASLAINVNVNVNFIYMAHLKQPRLTKVLYRLTHNHHKRQIKTKQKENYKYTVKLDHL